MPVPILTKLPEFVIGPDSSRLNACVLTTRRALGASSIGLLTPEPLVMLAVSRIPPLVRVVPLSSERSVPEPSDVALSMLTLGPSVVPTVPKVTPPVKDLAPASVRPWSRPSPVMRNPPGPLTGPLIQTSLLSPKLTKVLTKPPLNWNAFDNAPPELLPSKPVVRNVVPPAIVRIPVPTPVLFPRVSWPTLMVMPPLKAGVGVVAVFKPEIVRLPLLFLVRLPAPESLPETNSSPEPMPPRTVLADKVKPWERVTLLLLPWLICGRVPLFVPKERALPLTVNTGSELLKFARLSAKVPARSLLLIPVGVVLKINMPRLLPPATGATPPAQLAPADQLPGARLVQVCHCKTFKLTTAEGESVTPSLTLKVKLSVPV